jgi:hypothetical protein
MTLSQLERSSHRLHSIGASVLEPPGQRNPRRGQVLWGMRFSGRTVGIAWDWEEAQRNVVALADPMRVASNIILTDDNGELVGPSARIMCLNSLIHQLPWQDEFVAQEASFHQPLAA